MLIVSTEDPEPAEVVLLRGGRELLPSAMRNLSASRRRHQRFAGFTDGIVTCIHSSSSLALSHVVIIFLLTSTIEQTRAAARKGRGEGQKKGPAVEKKLRPYPTLRV